ncbi:MAG: tRNA dihydrouridine synthase DusB [Bacilli bacterium]|nr:tRNA dihydrouridine synthase DusB [Bacilli bacterium]
MSEYKIGNVKLKNNLILAPMAGVTNEAFRTICMEKGAGLVYAEMVSDKGLLYSNQKTHDMIKVSDAEHPIAMQLFGSSAETILEAAKIVEKNSGADILDINMGCPVNKVVKDGSGSALMKTPDKIYDIVKSLKDNINMPITIKIRAGWDNSSINCDEVARLASSAGVDAIAIHGRTRAKMYQGESSNEYIKMVRENTDKFVIGNGDLKTYNDLVEMAKTGCDAFMIGRASLGNPWVFEEMSGKEVLLMPQDIIMTLLDHAKRLCVLYGEKRAMVEMRTHAAWYFKMIKGTKEYRKKVVLIKTYQELEDICNEYLLNISNI